MPFILDNRVLGIRMLTYSLVRSGIWERNPKRRTGRLLEPRNGPRIGPHVPVENLGERGIGDPCTPTYLGL